MREFSPEFFSKPQEEPSQEKTGSFLTKLGENKMVRAGIVAVGIHGAIGGAREMREGIAYAAESAKNWSEGYVIRPQSDAVRKQVEADVRQRESRKDEKGLAAYKNEMSQRLERGEDVSFEESYFKQAEFNGVSHEEVVKAQKVVDGMVQHFASKLEGGLSDEEIKEISRSMFATAEYEWGQGNVVDYFLHHKRNCVAVDQAQEIVFEKLIQMLPEGQRGRYHLGKRFEHQHRFTVMSVSSASDLPPERYISLQPPYDTERSGFAPVGTATVSDYQIKEALAGKRIVVSAIKPNKGEAEVKTGPNIDAVVNQPVDEGIIVEGTLRSAIANHEQTERERITPIPQAEYDKKYGRIMEIEVRMDNPKDQSVDEIVRRVENAKYLDPLAYPVTVDLRSFTNPDEKVFDDIKKADLEVSEYSRFVFGDLKTWNRKAIEKMSAMSATELSIALDRTGLISDDFVDSIQNHVIREKSEMDSPSWKGGFTEDHLRWHVLELRQADKAGSASVDAQSLDRLLYWLEKFGDGSYMGTLDGGNNYRELKLDVETLSDQAFDALKKHPPSALHITKRLKSLWVSDGVTPTKAEIDELRRINKGLKSLGIPVFVEIDDLNLGRNQPVPCENYDFLLENDDFLFPEFSSMRRAAETNEADATDGFYTSLFMNGSTKNGATGEHLSPKAFLISEFFDRLAKEFHQHGIHKIEEWENLKRYYSALMIGDGRLGSDTKIPALLRKMNTLSEAELLQRKKLSDDYFDQF